MGYLSNIPGCGYPGAPLAGCGAAGYEPCPGAANPPAVEGPDGGGAYPPGGGAPPGGPEGATKPMLPEEKEKQVRLLINLLSI